MKLRLLGVSAIKLTVTSALNMALLDEMSWYLYGIMHSFDPSKVEMVCTFSTSRGMDSTLCAQQSSMWHQHLYWSYCQGNQFQSLHLLKMNFPLYFTG